MSKRRIHLCCCMCGGTYNWGQFFCQNFIGAMESQWEEKHHKLQDFYVDFNSII